VTLELSFWAKLGNATWPDKYHPVVCHLIDVGLVARRLWSDVCRSRVREWAATRLGLPDQDAAGSWLAFWAGAHDIGKVSPGFQAKSPQAKEALRKARFRFVGKDDTPHGTVSAAVLPKLFHQPTGWPPISERLAHQVAIAVGGHHGVFPGAGDCRLGTAALGDTSGKWDEARRAILAQLARALGIDRLSAPSGPGERDHATFLFLAGLTSVADWIGSASEFFEFAKGDVDLAEYPRKSEGMARRALDELGWTGWSGEAPPLPFEGLFPGRTARPLQAEAVRQAPGFGGPGLVLVEAPMGEGKTEAALFLADHWNHAVGQRGCYVALPTQATSNQMFGRVRDFLARRYPAERVNLHLLHGGSELSEAYRELRLAAIHDEHGSDDEGGAVVAESWFTPKKRGLLAPFAVGTIDQALLSVLQTRHGFVRLFGLAGKTVILDEVHAYDPYTTTLMKRLLEWLAALGCSVVLLSATLPRARRRELLEAYAGSAATIPECPYPRLITATNGAVTAVHVPPSEERRATVRVCWQEPGQLGDRLREALAGGGCAAVVCNTVGDAQRTYVALRDTLAPQAIEVRLFHARFPASWRQSIEQEVLNDFGGATENPRRPRASVLVATQVIEQSLDLDFDLLVSAVAPVDLVLQRAGRLHRHKGRPRPPGLTEPQLWLLRTDFDDQGVAAFGDSEFVYDRHVLLRSYLALRDRDQTPIRLPDDMETLIEQVYGEVPLAGPDAAWTAALQASRSELDRWRDQAEAKARYCVLKPPSFSGALLRDFNRELKEDAPDQHETLQALTRLAEPNVSVVLLRQTAGGLSDLRGRVVNLSRRPDLDGARRLLGSAVNLSRKALVYHFSGQPVPPGWRKCALLRHHRPAVLDALDTLRVGGCVLRLNRDMGVVIECGEGAVKTIQ
jgi:CRISPR-associated endonuclease/helicase Cas3